MCELSKGAARWRKDSRLMGAWGEGRGAFQFLQFFCKLKDISKKSTLHSFDLEAFSLNGVKYNRGNFSNLKKMAIWAV